MCGIFFFISLKGIEFKILDSMQSKLLRIKDSVTDTLLYHSKEKSIGLECTKTFGVSRTASPVT